MPACPLKPMSGWRGVVLLPIGWERDGVRVMTTRGHTLRLRCGLSEPQQEEVARLSPVGVTDRAL